MKRRIRGRAKARPYKLFARVDERPQVLRGGPFGTQDEPERQDLRERFRHDAIRQDCAWCVLPHLNMTKETA